MTADNNLPGEPRPAPLRPRRAGLLAGTLAIAWKDLRVELRSREIVSAMAVFALLSVLIFSFALELDRTGRAGSAAGVFWVTVIFAGMLGLGRSLGREMDERQLDGLLLAPVDRAALYFGKVITNFLTMLAVAAILLPLTALLFEAPISLPLIGVVLLGLLGFAAVGTLIASMAAYTRGRELLLPVLLLPIALSILIPAVRATRGLIEGADPEELSRWFGLLLATNLIYLVLSYMLYDFIVEE